MSHRMPVRPVAVQLSQRRARYRTGQDSTTESCKKTEYSHSISDANSQAT